MSKICHSFFRVFAVFSFVVKILLGRILRIALIRLPFSFPPCFGGRSPPD